MKRLMVAIAAVASAFGLYATDPITSTSFEGTLEFDEGGNLITGSAWTASADPDAKLTQGAYKGDDYTYTTDNDRYEVFGSDQDSYLSIKTALDKPASYAIGTEGASVENGAVYFDQLVKFTAADEDIEVTDAGAKIAFYVKDLTEAETPKTETNLYVVAGKYVGGELQKAVYEVKKGIDADAWHRLTVKAIKATSGSAGFEVFLDAVALTTGVNAYDGVEANLTDAARPLNSVKKLFPSLVEGVKVISSLAYAGQGAIDDVIATVDQPGAWAEDKNVSVSWDENVTALTYTINGGTPITATVADKVFEVPYESGLTITVNPTFAENWAFGGFEGEGFTQDGKTISFTSETGSAAIISKDTTPRIQVGDKFYPNFKEAIAAIGDNYPATLTINQNVTVDADAEIGTDAQFNGDVTIDLNGKTITGTATGFDGFVINCQGNLTIVDNSDGADGAIVMAADTEYAGVVGVLSPDENNRTLTITAGVFEGAVYAAEAEAGFGAVESAVSGGKFAYADNTTDGGEFALTCAKGFTANPDAEPDPTYWVVESLPAAKISLTATNATVDGIEDQADAYEGDELSFTVEADQYYDGVTVKINGAVQTPEEDTYTYTVTATDVANKVVTVEVTATAIEYTLTYSDGAEVPFEHKQTFTAANYDNLKIWDGVREDFTRVDEGWSDDEGNLVDIKATIAQKIADADETLDLTVYGEWEAEATEVTVTLTPSTGIASISETSVKGTPGEKKTVTLTAEDSIAIPVFMANGVQCSASYEVEILAAGYEITFTATDASSGDVTDDQAKKALEDKGVAPTATAKFPGNTKALATWMAAKGALPEAINASNYLKASVDLNVALITEQTAVATAADTFAATGTGLTFNIKVGDAEVAAEKILDYVQATDDLSTWSVDNVTKAVEAGAVKVTSTTGKAFAKVVIPTDDTIND